MPELTFFLNETTVNQFETWLKDYTEKKTISQSWMPDGTRNEWGLNPTERVSTLSSATVLVIPGWRRTTDTGTTPITLAKFSLLEGGDRLQIQMGYWANPQVSSFFAGLLADLAKWKPECSEVVAGHINPGKQAEATQAPVITGEQAKTLQTENPSYIDQLCLKWVKRTSIPYENMSEFLDRNNTEPEIFVSADQFKKALRSAGKRGLIVKGDNGRWTTR